MNIRKFFLVIALFSGHYLTTGFADSENIDTKPSLINNREINQLLREYISNESSAKRDEIKQRIAQIESNPDKVKQLLINLSQYNDTQYGIHEKRVKISNKNEKYFVYIPKGYNPNTPYPMIVSLHGVGEGGIAFMGRWLRHSNHGQNYILLCPHYDSGYWWEKDGEELVLSSIKQVCAEQNIDTNRIYLTGFSSGAHGAWYLSIRNSDMFAAIAPVAGECIIADQIVNLLHVPVFIIHGDQDGDIPIAAARDARDRLRKLNYEFKYLEIPGQRHAYPVKMSNEILNWFSSKKKDARPQTVYFTGNASHKNIYWIKFVKTSECFGLPGSMSPNDKPGSLSKGNNINGILQSDCHSIEVKVDGNNIIIKSQNIVKVILLLDENLIDVTKPVNVIVNNTPKFSGLVKPTIDSLLKSIEQEYDKNSVFARCIELTI